MKNEAHTQDALVCSIYARAEEIADRVVGNPPDPQTGFTAAADRIITSRLLALPLILALLAFLFWITIFGANYPSDLLARLFFWIEGLLVQAFTKLGSPPWLLGVLVSGLYRGLAWVAAVMLPPMAIFFPLFTLLEDLGFLPRLAFNLDRLFQKAGAHGKQALTMAMGFGCNAAGVVAARIIDSPRERLLAVLTNNLVPCNGRFPLLITMGTFLGAALFPGGSGSLAPALLVLGAVLLGVGATFLVSKVLAATILKGKPSFFVLELPPYRLPRLGQVLARSFLDRTLFVLARAMQVAAPAGVLIWILANTSVQKITLINHFSRWLDPLGRAMGLDGVILLSFILGLPANEIVIPAMLMNYLAAGALLELESLGAVRQVLLLNGWTGLTAFNFMVFTIFHWPCGTTLLTIKKETGSLKWAFLAALLPTLLGLALCLLITKLTTVFL
ncbi:MAG: ferrous iron transporter B [Firmicutes bacterium]|nr:ferrous iron transporter B [Bacillota bacterium]